MKKMVVVLATAALICTFSTVCLAGEPTEMEQAAMDDVLTQTEVGLPVAGRQDAEVVQSPEEMTQDKAAEIQMQLRAEQE